MTTNGTPQLRDEREQALHHEVMGIALAVRAICGENHLFRIMDRALDTVDADTLQHIVTAFNRLSPRKQSMLLFGLGAATEQITIVEELAGLVDRIIETAGARVTA